MGIQGLGRVIHSVFEHVQHTVDVSAENHLPVNPIPAPNPRLTRACGARNDMVPRGEKMLYYGTDPES